LQRRRVEKERYKTNEMKIKDRLLAQAYKELEEESKSMPRPLFSSHMAEIHRANERRQQQVNFDSELINEDDESTKKPEPKSKPKPKRESVLEPQLNTPTGQRTTSSHGQMGLRKARSEPELQLQSQSEPQLKSQQETVSSLTDIQSGGRTTKERLLVLQQKREMLRRTKLQSFVNPVTSKISTKITSRNTVNTSP